VNDLELDLFGDLDLDEGVFEGLDRTGDVALDDEVERGPLALLDPVEQVLQGDPTAAVGDLGGPVAGLSLLGDLPGGAVFAHRQEGVAGTWYGGQTEHLDRTGRTRLGHRLAVLVEHGAHTSMRVTGHDRVTDPQGAVIRGAHVTARQVETNLTAEAVTDGEGRFRFPYLRVGSYEITVRQSGFADATRHQGSQFWPQVFDD